MYARDRRAPRSHETGRPRNDAGIPVAVVDPRVGGCGGADTRVASSRVLREARHGIGSLGECIVPLYLSPFPNVIFHSSAIAHCRHLEQGCALNHTHCRAAQFTRLRCSTQGERDCPLATSAPESLRAFVALLMRRLVEGRTSCSLDDAVVRAI